MDGVELEILWSNLIGIVTERAKALQRIAFSPIVREAGDLACALFDQRGRMVVQANTGTPGHINSLAFAGAHLVRLFKDRCEPGDVLITVNIAPHPFFKVDGSDLRIDLPITLYEAVLGGKVRVPTLGGAVELSIPKNTSSGRIFRLKGKGLPKTGGTGDLFVTTKIVLPDGNDSELEQLMQKWRDGHPYNPRSDLG